MIFFRLLPASFEIHRSSPSTVNFFQLYVGGTGYATLLSGEKANAAQSSSMMYFGFWVSCGAAGKAARETRMTSAAIDAGARNLSFREPEGGIILRVTFSRGRISLRLASRS